MPWFVAALCFAWATFMTFNVLTRDDGPGLRRNAEISLGALASASGGGGGEDGAGVSAALEAERAPRKPRRFGGDPRRTDSDPETSAGVPRKAGTFGTGRRSRDAPRVGSRLRGGASEPFSSREDARARGGNDDGKKRLSVPSESAESAESAFLASAAPLPKSTYGLLDAMRDFPGFPRTPPVVLTPRSPKAYVFRNFLTAEECEHLRALAKKQLAPSTVVGTNGPVSSGIRTSAGTFLAKGQDAVVKRVEARMALAAGLPEPNGEGMQILRYEVGQKYDPHYDYFHDAANASPRRGGQRMATMLVYLADTEQGGETVFPKAKKPPGFDAGAAGDGWSDCASKGGVPVRSARGDAVLFWSLTEDYVLDPGSLHGACPVVKGEKWTAVKWMRVAKFDGGFPEDAKLPMPSLSVSRRSSGDEKERCRDDWAECADWAERGWCARNPEFMIGKQGARDSKGPACPQSCGVQCA